MELGGGQVDVFGVGEEGDCRDVDAGGQAAVGEGGGGLGEGFLVGVGLGGGGGIVVGGEC